MTGIFVGDTSPSKIFVGDTEVSKVFVGDTQVRPTSRIPIEYQEVEYIQSSNGQRINTGLTGNEIATWEIKFSPLGSKATAYEMYCGGGSGHSTGGKIFYQNYGSAKGITLQQSSTGDVLLFQLGDVAHVVSTTNGEVYCDGVLKRTYTPGAWGSGNFWLFNNSGESSYYASMKLYYFKAWSDGVLSRDLVPCYRKSDTVIGLYDIVNSVFYTNSGSGSFTKGPDV